jgi:hypothetical protein
LTGEEYKPTELADAAYRFYELLRPDIPTGVKGWGAAGNLDLAMIESLAKRR